MIIRIHNTGDPYKLPTLSVHASSFPRSIFLFLILSSSFLTQRIAPRRLPRPVLATFAKFSLFLFNPKKVYIPLSVSLYPFATPCRLPYGQMLPHNDLFLHLIPDLWSTTLSLFPSVSPCFSRSYLSRLPRNTTKRVTPRGWETIASPSAHLCTLKRWG